MLLAVNARLEPFSPVALEIFLQGQPMRTLGEVRWVREAQEGRWQEVEIEFVAMQDQDRERWVEEIYAPLKALASPPRASQ